MARVLAVDDNPGILDFVRRAAESNGHQVVTVASAVKIMSAYSSHAPDVVMLDVVMPGTDGIELIRWLGEVRCQARIVVVSGETSGPFREMAGMLARDNALRDVRTLPKPFRVSDLVAALEGYE